MTNAPNANEPRLCPSADILQKILGGEHRLSPNDPLLNHLETCPACERAMDALIERNESVMPAQELSAQEAPTLCLPLTGAGDSPEPGESRTESPRVPGFRLTKKVNKGGQGIVYKAIDVETGETVALKWLSFPGSGDSEPAGKEIMATGRLDHPGIVKIRRLIEWEGQAAIVMDWVEGGDLRDYLDQHTLSIAESVDFVIRICRILEYAHSRGLIHRDLKPSNILLSGGRIEEPKLTDFGLAKFEAPPGDFSTVTAGIGTPGYMAPELVSVDFGKVSQSTDIFSLGVILYEMLTGELPFDGKTLFDFLRRTCDEPARPLRNHSSLIPLDLDTICLKTLAKKPGDRYASAAELRMDLERFRDGQPILAQRASTIDLMMAWARRNPAVAISASAAFAILSVSVVTLSIFLERSRHSQQAAEKSLTLAIKAMSNAAPIYKRFAQNAIPDVHERSNLQQTAELCLQIGDDTRDLRLRCNSYFNALQMATAMRDQPGLSEFAESIARTTLEKYRKLKADHEDQLRSNVRQSGKDGWITDLDVVNVRIAYSMIELAYIIRGKGDAFRKEYENWLEQAIAQCEIALKENDTQEEAWAMLGNFLTSKYDQFVEMGDIDQARATIAKSVAYNRAFFEKKPEEIKRNFQYLAILGNHYMPLEYETEGLSDNFRAYVSEILAEIRQFRKTRPEGWQHLIIQRIERMSQEILLDYDRTNPPAAEALVDEFLDLIHEISDDAQKDSLLSNSVFASWNEMINQLCRRDRVEQARRECTRMETWLKSISGIDKYESLLFIFRLSAPFPEFRSTDQALKMAFPKGEEGPLAIKYSSWILAVKGAAMPDDLAALEATPFSPHFSQWISFVIVETLHRDPAEWSDESRQRFARLERLADRNPLLLGVNTLVHMEEIRIKADQANRPFPPSGANIEKMR